MNLDQVFNKDISVICSILTSVPVPATEKHHQHDKATTMLHIWDGIGDEQCLVSSRHDT